MKFTIITVSYNSENTIEKTIQSVLAQTYQDLEYLVIDGASTDHTIDIVKEYEPRFQGRLRFVSEPDNGIYDAMNKGIRMATGDIIGIVNSDDWLEPDALQIVDGCYKEHGNNENCLCCGWLNFQYNDGTVQVLKTSHELLLSMSSRYEMAGIRHPATFVPKAVYDRWGIFDESIKIMADTDLILRFLYNGVEFIYPDRVLSNMSDGGVSNAQLMKACRDYKLILRKNKVSGFKYYRLYLVWSIKRLIKICVPQSVLRKYRNRI